MAPGWSGRKHWVEKFRSGGSEGAECKVGPGWGEREMGASHLKEHVQRPWDRGGAWVKDGFVREANRNWDSYSSMGKGTVA